MASTLDVMAKCKCRKAALMPSQYNTCQTGGYCVIKYFFFIFIAKRMCKYPTMLILLFVIDS